MVFVSRWAKQKWHAEVERVLLMELPLAGPRPQRRIMGIMEGLHAVLPAIVSTPVTHLDGKGDFDQILDVVRRFLHRGKMTRTLVGAVNDTCAVATLRACEEAGGSRLCAAVGQNAIGAARQELRRPGTRLIGSVAYFPERYGNH